MLIPYCLWTLVLLFFRNKLSAPSLIEALLTGSATAQMYFLLVYAQLVFLTPVLSAILRTRRFAAALYCVIPSVLFVRSVIAYEFDVVLPIDPLFVSWLGFYLIGLEWRSRVEPFLAEHEVRAGTLILLVASGVIAQEAVGAFWMKRGVYEMATSQLKQISALTSLCFACPTVSLPERCRRHLAIAPLVFLGDCSFGTYLCHVVPAGFLVARVPLANPGLTIAIWLVVVASAALVVGMARRFLPKDLVRIVWFS